MSEDTLAAGSTARLGSIGVASAVAAVLTYLLHVAAGHLLGADGYARFIVVWGIFFTMVGIQQGMQQEVTRSVAAAENLTTDARRGGARVMLGSAIVGVAGTVVIVVLVPVWRAFHPHDSVGTGLVVAGAWAGYAFGQGINGVLAARRAWSTYAAAVLLEGVCRAVAFGAAVAVSRTSTIIALGLCGGLVAWVLLGATAAVRATWSARGDTSARGFMTRSGQAMAAAGCSALLVSGFPVLLELTSGHALDASAGVLLAVLVATRAPLQLFLNAYQGLFITRLMSVADPLRLVRRWSLWGLVVGVVGSVVGYAVGRPVVRLVFGPGFEAPRSLFPGLVMASLALALLTVTGWAVLARSRHTGFVLGWLVATAGTIAVLLVPLPVEARASTALVVGPLMGAAAHALLLSRRPG